MNTYSINDENFKNSDTYQKFLKENPKQGFLKIRANAANQAIPIEGVKITISKIIDNNNIIFFEGTTNESGMISKIKLPAPPIDINNLNIPNKATYDITAIYEKDNITNSYKVNIYEDVCVVQHINIIPKINYGEI